MVTDQAFHGVARLGGVGVDKGGVNPTGGVGPAGAFVAPGFVKYLTSISGETTGSGVVGAPAVDCGGGDCASAVYPSETAGGVIGTTGATGTGSGAMVGTGATGGNSRNETGGASGAGGAGAATAGGFVDKTGRVRNRNGTGPTIGK
jgi:hypothetical protein